MPRYRKSSTTSHLEEHSIAKVELINTYLAAYLSILEKSRYVDEVHVFDLMCGEGIYENGERGTAYEVLNTVKRHFYSRESPSNKISIWLNDKGMSDVEPGRTKVARAEEACSKLVEQLPDHYRASFSDRDALDLAFSSLREIGTSPRRRFLFIIDPTGYKDVTPSALREIFSYEGVEVILFVPVSFMYRFIKAKENPFPGSEPLRKWLDALWSDDPVESEGEADFLSQLARRLDASLGETTYLTTIQIDSRTRNRYALVFVTQHLRGLEVMLETKWKYDPERGEGHRRGRKQFAMFNPSLDQFESDLLSFIASSLNGRSNVEIAIFTIKNGFLPTHARSILLAQRKKAVLTVTEVADGSKARGFYLTRKSRNDRSVVVRLTQPALL